MRHFGVSLHTDLVDAGRGTEVCMHRTVAQPSQSGGWLHPLGGKARRRHSGPGRKLELQFEYIFCEINDTPAAEKQRGSFSGLVNPSEVVVDQGFDRNTKQFSDIQHTNRIHVEAPAGFPIPDDLGVRADQICKLPTAVMVPSAEESKVFPELTVVQYNDHSITLHKDIIAYYYMLLYMYCQ